MNREDLKKYKDIDFKKFEFTEKKLNHMCEMINRLFMFEFKEDEKSAEAVLYAAVFSPISFAMNIFEQLHEIGVDPSKEYPKFLNVYRNYLSTLDQMTDEWGTVPFREFQKKFADLYSKEHLVYGYDVEKDKNETN